MFSSKEIAAIKREIKRLEKAQALSRDSNVQKLIESLIREKRQELIAGNNSKPTTSEKIPMKAETRERWIRLCERAANEQDGHKLLQIVGEINRLLEEKQTRLNNRKKPPER